MERLLLWGGGAPAAVDCGALEVVDVEGARDRDAGSPRLQRVGHDNDVVLARRFFFGRRVQHLLVFAQRHLEHANDAAHALAVDVARHHRLVNVALGRRAHLTLFDL